MRGVPIKRAGVRITHDVALTYGPVWAAVRLISETLAGLPWAVRRRVDDEDTEAVRDHPVRFLLNVESNPESAAFNFRRTLMAHVLTWGNGYAEIERAASGAPLALWPVPPDRVKPERAPEDGRLRYRVFGATGDAKIIEARNMLHVPGFGFDGIVGYSVVSHMATTIGLGLASQQYGASFFANNGSVGAVFEHPQGLSDDAMKHLEDSFAAKFSGPQNAFKMFILDEGMKLTWPNLPNKDSQFLETRQFEVTEIARWFGVPPHLIGDLSRSTFSNIEHQEIEFVQHVLTRWATQLQQEFDRKLLMPRERARVFTRINLNGLLRGDVKTRVLLYTKLLDRAVLSVNEVRRLEDMNGIGPDGDQRSIALNMQALEQLGEDEDDEERAATALDLTGRLRAGVRTNGDARP